MASIMVLGNPGYDVYYSIVDGAVHEITKIVDGEYKPLPLCEAPYVLQQLATARSKRGGTRVSSCEGRYAKKGYISLLGVE